VLISSGPPQWEKFSSFCARLNLKGNLIPDAYLAAMAIESPASPLFPAHAKRWTAPQFSSQYPTDA
jgi:hypothetical protein